MKRGISIMFWLSAAACVLWPWPDNWTVRDVLMNLGAMCGFTAMGLFAWEAGS